MVSAACLAHVRFLTATVKVGLACLCDMSLLCVCALVFVCAGLDFEVSKCVCVCVIPCLRTGSKRRCFPIFRTRVPARSAGLRVVQHTRQGGA